MTEAQRTLLLTIRQALIIALGALEEYLGLPRSIVPKHERRAMAGKGAPELRPDPPAR